MVERISFILVSPVLATLLCGFAVADCPSADLTGDCFVDSEDFALMADRWLITDSNIMHIPKITYLGKTSKVTDFRTLGWGSIGYYFPQFDGEDNVGPERTDDNMRFSMPRWIAFEFNFWKSGRTFSLDAGIVSWSPFIIGVYSKGGEDDWDVWTLPTGETGRSGCVVDKAAADNLNNTVNRIQLGGSTPSSFILRIVTDNTGNEHDSAGSLTVRAGSDNDPSLDVRCPVTDLYFDGTTDVYSFRYDNFEDGDFIKIRLNSGDSGMYPGFGGLMFD